MMKLMKLPDKYRLKMEEILKDEYDSYLDSFKEKPVRSLRVNTGKISVEEFKKRVPFHLEEIPWSSDGFYFAEEDNVTSHPYYYAGLYYIQEASAMYPAEVLDVEEGDVILDCCAAPGGKSTKIINKFDDGLLISNDISSSRSQALLRNLERFGAERDYVTSEDISRFPEDYFTKIIIDAPCSGEGMFRKGPSLIKSWLERGSEYYSPIQSDIIEKSYRLLKKGGEIVYSTCTFDRSEDEEIIRKFLNAHPDMKTVKLPVYKGFYECEDGLGVKLFPHRIKGEGHFTAKLLKDGSHENRISHKKTDSPDYEFFKLIHKDFHDGRFMTIKDRLFFVPEGGISGLRILRSGLYLGEIKNKDLEPSQALAMALKPEEFENTVRLDAGDIRVMKYLKGETVKIEGCREGWNLLCVDEFPLGFLKVSNGVSKNRIDKGWILR